MRDLDETDLEILQLLLADARRPYSDIAEAVDLSAPAVSDRVARLQEMGIVRRFTVDVDRSQLRTGVPVLVTVGLAGGPEAAEAATETLLSAEAVEHVFRTAEGDVVVYARVADTDVAAWVTGALGEDAVAEVDVTLLSDAEWSPDLAGTEFALDCAECGNTVDSEGTAARVGDALYQFCCPSCEARFREQYEQLEQDAD